MKILSGAKDIYLLSLESTTENFLRKSSDPIQKKLLFNAQNYSLTWKVLVTPKISKFLA